MALARPVASLTARACAMVICQLAKITNALINMAAARRFARIQASIIPKDTIAIGAMAVNQAGQPRASVSKKKTVDSEKLENTDG